MKLTYLSINEDWGKDTYTCKVTFAQAGNEVTLRLPAETTDRIREVVADLIVAAARDTANQIARDVIIGNILPAPGA